MLKIDICLKNHLHLCSGKELVPSISERLIFVLSVQSLNFIWYSAQLQSYLQYGKCWLRSKVRGPAYQHWQQIFWTLIHFKYTQSIVSFSCKKFIFIMLNLFVVIWFNGWIFRESHKRISLFCNKGFHLHFSCWLAPNDIHLYITNWST